MSRITTCVLGRGDSKERKEKERETGKCMERRNGEEGKRCRRRKWSREGREHKREEREKREGGKWRERITGVLLSLLRLRLQDERKQKALYSYLFILIIFIIILFSCSFSSLSSFPSSSYKKLFLPQFMQTGIDSGKKTFSDHVVVRQRKVAAQVVGGHRHDHEEMLRSIH